jgi:biopolymer transport protein ExbD
MLGKALRTVGLALAIVVVAAPAPAGAATADSGDYDVVIVIDDSSVTYNGNPVSGLYDLEAELVSDVEQNPQLTVEVQAYDTVPAAYIVQIMKTIRQYEVDCTLEMISSHSSEPGQSM